VKRLLGLLGLLLVVVAGCSLNQADPATEVTDISAQLNGKLSSNQEGEVLYWFEYGTTTDYGSSTPDRSVTFPEGHTSDDPPVGVSQNITGLEPETTYHYRACSSPGAEAGSRGCVNQDQTFTTGAATTHRYIALGDSLTQVGDPVRYPERFFSYLEGAGQADELHNIGENGQTSTGILGSQLTAANDLIDDSDTDTTVVTLDIGGNDILTNSSCLPSSASFSLADCQPILAQFSTNFASLLESLNDSLADDPGVEQLIVFAYYNPWSGRPGQATAADNGDLALRGSDRTLDCDGIGDELGLNDRIACIGRSHGAKVVDAYPPFVGHGTIGDYFSDDVHPNGTGHQVIANLFQAAFEAPEP
jgi:lysophospholipase L1-like esterase